MRVFNKYFFAMETWVVNGFSHAEVRQALMAMFPQRVAVLKQFYARDGTVWLPTVLWTMALSRCWKHSLTIMRVCKALFARDFYSISTRFYFILYTSHPANKNLPLGHSTPARLPQRGIYGGLVCAGGVWGRGRCYTGFGPIPDCRELVCGKRGCIGLHHLQPIVIRRVMRRRHHDAATGLQVMGGKIHLFGAAQPQIQHLDPGPLQRHSNGISNRGRSL